MSSSNPPPEEYFCLFCGELFYTNIALMEHACIRSQRTIYACTICKKEYSKKNDLTRHERKHTGERPFICVRCGRDFARKSTLVAHFATHYSFESLLETANSDTSSERSRATDASPTSQTDQNTLGSNVVRGSLDLTSASSSKTGTQRVTLPHHTKGSDSQGDAMHRQSNLKNRRISNIKHRRTFSGKSFINDRNLLTVPQRNLSIQYDITISPWMTQSEPNLALVPADTCKDQTLSGSVTRSGDDLSDVTQEPLNTQSNQTANDSITGGIPYQPELPQESRNLPPTTSVIRRGHSLSDITQESLKTQSDQTASNFNAVNGQPELPQDLRDFVNQPPTSSVTMEENDTLPGLNVTALPEAIFSHSNDPWRCDNCGAEFSDWDSYVSHAKEYV